MFTCVLGRYVASTVLELGSSVKVEVAVLGSPTLIIVRTVSVDVNKHWI